PTSPGVTAPAGDKPDFKPEELEQLAAPIALYPDSLISQVLMASTYPVEIVASDRWVKANPNLKGDAPAKELEQKSSDHSGKSLVAVPLVHTMMSDSIETTVKIGDAFIGQQKEGMAAIQKLRGKGHDTGSLKTPNEQTAPATVQEGPQVIVIESKPPDV